MITPTDEMVRVEDRGTFPGFLSRSEIEKTNVLRNIQFFSELKEKDLHQVAGIAMQITVAKGGEIFSEGDPAENLFILNSGRVEVFKLNADGKKQLMRTVMPGEMFAEAAMFSGHTYPAFADAVKQSEVLTIAKNDLLDLLQTNPQLSLNMLGALSKLLRKLTKKIEDYTLKCVSARVASFLLDHSAKVERDTFTLNMKMGE